MKPLFVLLACYLTGLMLGKYGHRKINTTHWARLSMSLMLLFTALGHFLYAEGMALMVPPIFPKPLLIVQLTGIAEGLMATGLLLPAYRKRTAWILIVFFILVLPANIYAAIHHINYQHPEQTGPGLDYLWLRVPLQVFYILWVYYTCLFSAKSTG